MYEGRAEQVSADSYGNGRNRKYICMSLNHEYAWLAEASETSCVAVMEIPMRATAILFAALALSLSCGCKERTAKQPVTNETVTVAPEPSPGVKPEPSLSVSPRALDSHRVEFTITTTVPLPIKVATSIDLEGQKDSDTYIGYQGEFLTISQPITKVILDTAKADHPLPAAHYVASVDFFPKWGAEGNPAAAKLPELHATHIFKLGGGGGTRASAELQRTRQKWVMENVSVNEPWDPGRFENALGGLEKGPSDLSRLHDAYYAPGADMTLIVNRVRKTVSVWRMGRATQ